MPKYVTEWNYNTTTHRDTISIAEDDWMEDYLVINLSTRHSDQRDYETDNIIMDPHTARALHEFLGQWLEGKP